MQQQPNPGQHLGGVVGVAAQLRALQRPEAQRKHHHRREQQQTALQREVLRRNLFFETFRVFEDYGLRIAHSSSTSLPISFVVRFFDPAQTPFSSQFALKTSTASLGTKHMTGMPLSDCWRPA